MQTIKQPFLFCSYKLQHIGQHYLNKCKKRNLMQLFLHVEYFENICQAKEIDDFEQIGHIHT